VRSEKPAAAMLNLTLIAADPVLRGAKMCFVERMDSATGR